MHAGSMLVSKTVKKARTTDLQVRGLPLSLREKIRTRARKKGQTMSRCVIDVLRKDTERLSLEEWLELVRAHPIRTRGAMTGAQAVREARRLEEGLEP